ncbi:MAG TPA: hypothetical protein VH023_14060, partial [Rhodopila sp.]|nr:hypothetical protein [Rhodopila sp.]
LGINLSSCTVCADELKGLLEDIKATGAPVTASLAWEKLYIGGVGFRQATTAQSLSELGGAGWQLTGPRELSPSTSAGGGAVHVEPLESR